VGLFSRDNRVKLQDARLRGHYAPLTGKQLLAVREITVSSPSGLGSPGIAFFGLVDIEDEGIMFLRNPYNVAYQKA
jgi:hypothetical protein